MQYTERDKRICDRIKAVLLADKGWTSEQIAEALLITDQAVRNHIEEYKASSKLRLENGGSEEKVSGMESLETFNDVNDTTIRTI